MRAIGLTIILFSLFVCGMVEPARAELHLQSKIEAACGPVAPVTQTLLRWKSSCANNDCFAWRLTCANGKNYDMQSKLHPATTELQNTFYEWVPWSFLLYLLPFLIYAALAVVGSDAPVLWAALNAGFVGYGLCAAWSLCASITGNPWGPWSEEERVLFLNPYSYGAVLVAFALINLSAVRRGLETFLYRHAPDSGFAPVVMPTHSMHAAAMSAALMPNIYEFVDPAETASYYRRETEQLRAVREKLDAQTALAESVIRNRRARNRFQQHD
jgi:hypothetical protein